MRSAFIRSLGDLMRRDERVMLLTADLGFGVVEELAHERPLQFLNVGVAEQNMMGVAAGLASCGRIVFTYSIGNFPTLRCLEQIRNDICYHGRDVKIVTVGGGFSYGSLGYSHHALEDLAVMRALPGMTVVAPGDPVEAAAATTALARTSGPAYLRLGRAGEPVIHNEGFDYRLGVAPTIGDGCDVALISTGALLATAVDSAQRLRQLGVMATVVSMHTLKPLDRECVLRVATRCSALVTIEEHSLIGGLGSAVAELLADARLAGVRLKRIGVPSTCEYSVGGHESLRERFGLTPAAITRAVVDLLAEMKAPLLRT